MCDDTDPVGISNVAYGASESSKDEYATVDPNEGCTTREKLDALRAHSSVPKFADHLAEIHQEFEYGRHHAGFVAYGDVRPGDKVLIAASNLHESSLVEAIVDALKKKGARKVDIMILDDGPDRELNYRDEIERIIRTEPWWVNPRWYDYQEGVMNYAKDNGYDMLIHGRGGPIPKSNAKGEMLPFKFEALPWHTDEIFLSKANIFPPRLNNLINVKTWNMIYREGRGGKAKVTDPEGTQLEFTLHEKYYDRQLDERGGFGPRPSLGHLFGHPTPPIIEEEDAIGTIAGTTSHLTRPYPHIKTNLEAGKVLSIEGGGGYGDAWRPLMERTDSIQYPEFPRKGLFWLWEFAIGTNPKVRRPSNFLRLGGGGNEIERGRSGVIHAGFGTRWRGKSEVWAGKQGVPYGHLHVHLLFPTFEIKNPQGRTLTVIRNGRLTALDDPEVRELARKYGDPDELLNEDWIPRIPGINAEGKYGEYARDPFQWFKSSSS